MGVTACCCCSSKDAAITIGIWSLVSSIAQLGIMGWQMAAIKYERDRAANILLPNYNTYGRFDVPSYFESYWQSPEERYYTGLFVIQVLCLIAAFFLVFAAAAMIYGVHSWSKYLVWPWFPCMISSILASLAYCIMWWCGDIRDYWVALTIIEIIVVFINIYCVVIVMMYYRRINATTDEYEGKDRRGVRYKINRHANSRRDLLDSYDEGVHRSPQVKHGAPYKPLAQPYPVYPSYSRAGVPQTPLPLPPTQANTPYPIDPMEMQFKMEPKVKNIRELDDDPVGSWVREQQSIDRGHEARSEPISASKQVQPTTLQHSRSVPSLHGGTLVSHRDCDHRGEKHRSSSRRRRSRSRFDYDGYSSDSDPTELTRGHRHRSSSKRRHRSRSRFDESVTNYDSEQERERRRSKRHRHGGSQRSSSKRHEKRERERERERDREREREEREKERRPRERREEDRRSRHEASGGSQEMTFPLSGGITIPQHIVIPPSSGERGPDGQPIPQKYHINSEITINYDHNGRPVNSLPVLEEPIRRRQPMHLDLPSIVVSSDDDHTDGSKRLLNPLMPLMMTQMAFSQRKWKTMSSLRQHPTSPTSPVARNVYSRASVDVESGEVHSHKRPYTPGASPREILLAQSHRQLSSPSQTSPHGSRFMDGYRRRMRQASLNLPSETKLDEDLGFPPVCSPPPEVFCGSISGNQMRNRSHSDANSAMRMQSSHSLGNHSSGGGLLVFFPTSPSSSANNSAAQILNRRESHTDETAEEAIVWSTNNDISDEMMGPEDDVCDDVSMKDVEVMVEKSLKRPPDLNNGISLKLDENIVIATVVLKRKLYGSNTGSLSGGNLANVVQACNSYSPRSRPLFVDTQMANVDTLKRRSPVSQVVDFVRGRNRTYSLQLSSSPMSPQSVAARASASCDTQPAGLIGHSPGGRRQTVSGRIHRSSFTAGGTLKSFDSGLDLSSPTINHTALLIKEASLFSSFDSMSIGTAVPDINAIFFDNHDAVYSLFMKAHKCYDLIPTSSKLVVFDTHLPVRKAFYALVYNGVRAAPLWDTENQRFTGMLTITDFIKILCKHYDQGDNAERIRALEDQQISHWREQFERDGTIRPFVSIDPNESLHRAVELLCESKVHRLPVLDKKTGNITYILTHKRIMKFLSLYMRDLPRPSFMSSTPRDLGIGAWGDILCCNVNTPIHDALELFLKNRVSALPLVDENGCVVDIYAKFDVISLAAENSYDKLDCTVQEALKHRSEWFEGVQTCLETDSLFTVLEAIVKAEVHRLIVTDQEKKVVGVVSLSDILKYLVLDPCQKPPEQPTASQPAPPTRNASGTSTGGSTDSPPNSIPEGVEIDEEDGDEMPPPSIPCTSSSQA